MRVHHLDCCTMRPFGSEALKLVSHCLLLETAAHGLVLVDTGLGVEDVEHPRRLGALFGPMMAINARSQTPALRHIEALGFRREDVRHIVLTHLDFDHAGGLADFPDATVHVHATEQSAARARKGFMEGTRYRSVQLAHGPRWGAYEALGEPWNGMPAVRQLEGLPPEILALPLAGHSHGHAAIAVDTGRTWLVHAGDAYFHRSAVERGDTKAMPFALRCVERFIAVDYPRVRSNHAALAQLARRDGVTVFSAHDPVEFERLRAAARR